MSKALEDAGLAGARTAAERTRVDAWLARAPIDPAERTRTAIAAAEEMSKKAVGIKHDDGKPAMHLIPPEALDALAQVLGFGATKYEPRNWERGLLYSRVFAAAMRHLWAWWRGDGPDAETGFSHLDHTLTCVAFLVAYERRKMSSFDDRPRGAP